MDKWTNGSLVKPPRKKLHKTTTGMCANDDGLICSLLGHTGHGIVLHLAMGWPVVAVIFTFTKLALTFNNLFAAAIVTGWYIVCWFIGLIRILDRTS